MSLVLIIFSQIMIEHNIHQIWVGPYPLPYREKQYIHNICKQNPSYNHMLWTDNNLPTLPNNIQLLFDFFQKKEDYAFQADILRIFLVYKYGGMYLDVDFRADLPLDELDLSGDALFGYHRNINDHTIPNGFFAGRREAMVFKYLIDNIDIKKESWYGPSWLGRTVKEFLNLPYSIDKLSLINSASPHNINFILWENLEKVIKHTALYSWAPENKLKFKLGDINYTDEP